MSAPLLQTRDLQLAFRRKSEWLGAVFFLVVVAAPHLWPPAQKGARKDWRHLPCMHAGESWASWLGVAGLDVDVKPASLHFTDSTHLLEAARLKGQLSAQVGQESRPMDGLLDRAVFFAERSRLMWENYFLSFGKYPHISIATLCILKTAQKTKY